MWNIFVIIHFDSSKFTVHEKCSELEVVQWDLCELSHMLCFSTVIFNFLWAQRITYVSNVYCTRYIISESSKHQLRDKKQVAVRTALPANSACKMLRDAAKLGRGRRGDKSFCIALCERSDAPALLGTTCLSCAHLSAMRKLWNSESNFKQWRMCLLFVVTGRLFAVNV